MSTPTDVNDILQYLNIIELLQSQGFSLPGPGGIPERFTNPNYVPPDNSRALVVVSIISMVIAAIVVGLRLFTRLHYSGLRLGADDWLILAATILAVGFTIVQCLSAGYGAGKHVWDLTLPGIDGGFRSVFAHEVICLWTICLTKLSIILFIRRIVGGPNTKMRKVCDGFFAAHILFALGSTFTVVFQCKPIAASWDIMTRLQHKCSSVNTYYVVTALSIGSDVAVLVLPMFSVWKLALPLRKKFEVSFMFSIGGLACVCGVLRLYCLFDVLHGFDFSWGWRNVAIWGQLETTVAITCSSLPAVKLLLQKLSSKVFGSISPRSKKSTGNSTFMDRDITNNTNTLTSRISFNFISQELGKETNPWDWDMEKRAATACEGVDVLTTSGHSQTKVLPPLPVARPSHVESSISRPTASRWNSGTTTHGDIIIYNDAGSLSDFDYGPTTPGMTPWAPLSPRPLTTTDEPPH